MLNTQRPSVSSSPSTSQRISFRDAARLQVSFSADVEKRVLLWLANRTPTWINSDHLTVLGFGAQFLTGTSYALARWNRFWLLFAVFFIALNWLGDSLDGTLARVRKRERPRYGFYVDHVVDTLSALFLIAGLALSGYVQPAIAFGMLIAFLMLSIEAYLAAYALGQFQLSYWRLGPTEIRLLLVLGNLAVLRHADVKLVGSSFRLFDVGGVIAIAGMSLMFIISAIRHTRTLYLAERI